MTDVAEVSLLLRARRDPSLQGEIARARTELASLGAETGRTGQAQAGAARGAGALASAEAGLGAVLERNAVRLRALRDETVRAAEARAAAIRADLAAAAAAETHAAATSRLGGAMANGRLQAQNVAFQIQDIAVQMQAGTSAAVALGQNLPQLLGGFGVLGAAAGAAVAVLGPLGFAMLGMGDKGEKAASATDRLADATDRLRGLDRMRGDVKAIGDEYGVLTRRVYELIEARRAQAREAALDAARERVPEVSALFATPSGAGRDTARNIAARFGRTTGPLGLGDPNAVVFLTRALDRLERAGTLGEIAEAAAATRDRLVEASGGMERLNANGAVLYKLLLDVEEESLKAAAATGEMERGIGASAARARELAAELGAAGASLADMARDAAGRLARAEISLDFAGDPIGEAGAQAARRAEEEIARIRKALAASGLADEALAQGLVFANDKAREIVANTVDAERAERQAAAAAEGLARALGAAADRATVLANEAARARAALGGIGISATEDLERARLELAHRGNPVALARGLAEREAAARLRDVVQTSADIPAALRPAYLAGQRATAEQAVEERAEAAALRARRTALDAADSRAARGGAGAGRAAEREDGRRAALIAEIEAETAAVMRRIEAGRLGAAAQREAMALEEQEQALRRAGLTLADLEGGAAQARARAIAEASRAFFEASSAEEAMAETRRAVAAEIGLSYDQMRAEAERWRDATLAALAGAGQGHADYAAEVEAVFAQRLEDAYRQDLDRRTDWAAGVERAMLDITGDLGDMATFSEDLIRQSFQGMEDAFVELATTGKLSVGDLVEFSIRQLYRLAAASAIDLAGGGGGGLLGTIFSSLTGVVLGGSALAPAASPVPVPAPRLHGGGFRADGVTGLFDPAVFAGAPRLHGGGLKPGEFAAVLEDDERVLTAAQQDATARTIEGLARLAAAPRAQAAPALPRVTVNVYGGDGERREAAAQATGDGQGGLTVDVMLDQVDAGMARRIATGRGPTHQAIAQRFDLAPRGGR